MEQFFRSIHAPSIACLSIQSDEEPKKDIARFTKLAREFYYMGEGCPAGDTLRMVVVADGEWIGLLLWGSACYRLKHRDEWIG
jgi:hypothetical protein